MGNKRLTDSFILALSGEISKSKMLTPGCEHVNQACEFLISHPPAGTREEERRGVGWATLNSLHIGWFPVCSGA